MLWQLVILLLQKKFYGTHYLFGIAIQDSYCSIGDSVPISAGQHSSVMIFLLLLLQPQGHMGHEIQTLWYERDSTISLECIDSGRWTRTSKVSCGKIAASDAVYKFGHVVIEEACMVCRAGGAPREVGV